MAEEVRINLTSSADTSGVDKMGAAVGGIAGGTDKAAAGLGTVSKESKALASELGRGVEVGNAAVTMLQNAASASGGGAAGLIAMTRAGFGAGAMFKGLLANMGPFGIAAAAIGIAAGMISSALKSVDEKAAETKREAEKLNQLSLQDFKKQFDSIEEWANGAKRAIDAIADAADRVADKKLGAELSELRASRLPEEVKAEREAQLRQRREDEKRQGTLTVLQSKARVDQDALFQEQQVQAEVEAKLNTQLAALQELRDALASETRARAAVDYAGPEGYTPEQMRALDAATARRANAEQAAKGFTDETVNQTAAAMKEAVEKSATAAARAAATTAAAELERKTQGQESPFINRARAAEQAGRAADTPEAREARAKQIADMQRTPESVWRARAASGGMSEADRALFGDAFPKSKALPGVAASLKEATDAVQSQGTGEEEAAAAAKLAEAQKAHAEARAASDTGIRAGFAATAEVTRALAANDAQLAASLRQVVAELATVKQQVAANRSRSGT